MRLKTSINFFSLFICFCFPYIAVSQTNNSQIGDEYISFLIQKVQAKSKINRTAYLSEYERTFKLTIEQENKNKINSWVFEQYCLNDGKPYCIIIEIEKNGKSRSPSEIQKDRKKTAKSLAKNENYAEANNLFGYGTSMNSLWIDPTLYLKNCRVVSSGKKQVEKRTAILLRIDDCKLDDVYSKWEAVLNFMPKTEAEILIDEKDESVMQMTVYAKKEFSSATGQNKPIITMENTRMPEGLWLFKKIRLETIGNKEIFPNLKDNWQFDFHGYKRYEVTVEEMKLK